MSELIVELVLLGLAFAHLKSTDHRTTQLDDSAILDSFVEQLQANNAKSSSPLDSNLGACGAHCECIPP